MNSKLLLLSASLCLSAAKLPAQNIGINTTTPQATLDVRGTQRTGGISNYITYDSATGKIQWVGASLFTPVSQQIIRHSASSEGLYAGGGKLDYRNSSGTPVFYSDWTNGNGYFSGNLGINYLNPMVPLSFNGNLGDKIALWTDGTPTYYGFGVQSSLFQMFSKTSIDDIAFGYGSSTSFTEAMRIKGNGKVGIGLINPAEKLEVAGAVKATQYKFSAPKISYYSIDATAFTNANDIVDVQKLQGQGAFIGGSLIELVAPVNLPHNASIVSVTAYIYDNTPTQDLYVGLSRRDASMYRLGLGFVESSGAPGLNSYSFSPHETIDNSQYSYMVEAVPVSNTWPANGDLRIKRIVIAYSVNEAE
jgi:hypothetical protein